MRSFAVKELSDISGVSVRTLHYYDQISLLKPLHRSEAGYRFYGEAQLIRLQQILFFRELDFTLKEILDMLEDPAFDVVEALESHKTSLIQRKNRLNHLLLTIDHTIQNYKKGNIMKKPEMLYEGLSKEFASTYREEAKQKYGTDQIEKAEVELMKLGKKGFEQLKTDFDKINISLFKLRHEPHDTEKVQDLIDAHYHAIRSFWGTANTPDNQAEAYAGLGELYVHDDRYTTMDGEPHPEFASFLKKAMSHYAKTQLGLK